jgi:hypothetical protein
MPEAPFPVPALSPRREGGEKVYGSKLTFFRYRIYYYFAKGDINAELMEGSITKRRKSSTFLPKTKMSRFFGL